MFLVETGEGRLFAICKRRLFFGCLATVSSLVKLASGRGEGESRPTPETQAGGDGSDQLGREIVGIFTVVCGESSLDEMADRNP